MISIRDPRSSQFIFTACCAALDLVKEGLADNYAAELYQDLCVIFTLIYDTHLVLSSMSENVTHVAITDIPTARDIIIETLVCIDPGQVKLALDDLLPGCQLKVSDRINSELKELHV